MGRLFLDQPLRKTGENDAVVELNLLTHPHLRHRMDLVHYMSAPLALLL